MSEKFTKNQIIVAVVVAALVAAGVWYWYWQRRELPDTEAKTAVEPAGVGAQIFESAQNPLKEELPDTNPFAADTNPFDVNTNPFRSEYKNPFQ